jgi:hypothetical protein
VIVRAYRKTGTRFVCSAIFFVISCQFWIIKTLFGFKILFVISLISLQKICNRPSQIHCLNSDGTMDLSLLRYKPDFVTSLFVISELYCILLPHFGQIGHHFNFIEYKILYKIYPLFKDGLENLIGLTERF